MSIPIGRYKERIEIHSRTLAQDSLGQMVPTYALLYTLWAQYKSTGGNENFEAKEKTALSYVEFNVRYQGITLDATMQVKWNGEFYNITDISMEDFKSYYNLRCVAKDNNA